MQCPRCLRTIRSGGVSCPKCGLIFSLWEKGLARIQDTAFDSGTGDPEMDALWRRVIRAPGDHSTHEAFLLHCRAHHRLDLAARRYREFLSHSPESRAAAAFRDRIILLAQLEHLPARRPSPPIRRFDGIKIVLCLGAAALLWVLLMARLILVR